MKLGTWLDSLETVGKRQHKVFVMNSETSQDTFAKEVRVDNPNGGVDPSISDVHTADTVNPTPFSSTQVDASIRTAEDDLNADYPAYSATSVDPSPVHESQVKDIQNKVSAVLSNLPDYVGNFFRTYKQPIVTVGLVIGSIIVLRVLFATLDAIFDTIDDVPFLTSLLELTGLVFWIWFTYRYLLQASNRQELVDTFNSTKARILGRT
jgi:hypothetical protein